MEAGAQSAWISRELKRLGHEVIVANPRDVKWITASDSKNDPGDARKLALLARADVRLLHPVEHRTAEQQAEMGVIRARDAILRSRTLLVNAARGIAKGFGVRLPKSLTETFGRRALAVVPELLRAALTGVLEQIDALSRRIAGYDQHIGALADLHPEVARLESIPGVGRLTAATFVVTLGRAERFPHSRDVARVSGIAAQAAAERRARSAVGDFQKRRSVFTQTAGAVRAPHPGPFRQGFGAAPMGLCRKVEGQQSHQTSDCGGGPQTRRAAAPPVGERRILSTLS